MKMGWEFVSKKEFGGRWEKESKVHVVDTSYL